MSGGRNWLAQLQGAISLNKLTKTVFTVFLTVLQTFCEGPNNGGPSLAKFHEGPDPRTLAGSTPILPGQRQLWTVQECWTSYVVCRPLASAIKPSHRNALWPTKEGWFIIAHLQYTVIIARRFMNRLRDFLLMLNSNRGRITCRLRDISRIGCGFEAY